MPLPRTHKVLIVSPHFSPVNAPDMQRVRMALPFLRDLGWEPTVLAVDPRCVEGAVIEPMLEKTYPSDIRVVRVVGVSARLTRWAGFGSLWLRCGRAIRAEGERLLSKEKFDLVFFSTTQFDAFALGPIWKKKFGVPYVLDYQDPWINDYYRRTGTRPPGGPLKFAFSQWNARRREPAALMGASAVVSVSEAYGTSFMERYPSFDRSRLSVLPFGAADMDIAAARTFRPAHALIPFGDGNFHHVYAGRCGPDMTTSLTLVFRAFKIFLAERPQEAARIRFHFIGTDYAPRPLGRDWAMPIARTEGVEKYVSEHRYRVPYFEALSYLVNADALLAVGSNDPTYSASKIFPYVLARRPMLVVFNQRSPIIAIANSLRCGVRFSFSDATDINALSQEIAEQWFFSGKMREFRGADGDAFSPYTARSVTERLASSFNASLPGESSQK